MTLTYLQRPQKGSVPAMRSLNGSLIWCNEMIIAEHAFEGEVFVYLWPMDAGEGEIEIVTLFVRSIGQTPTSRYAMHSCSC